MSAWRLDAGAATLVLASEGEGLPAVVWLGGALPPGEDPAALTAAGRRSPQGGELDVVASASVCPEPARGWPGWPGLEAARTHRPLAPRLCGEGAVDGATFRWRGEDRAAGLAYALNVRVEGDGLFALSAALTNAGADALRVAWLCAPALPAPARCRETVEFSGRWCGEFRESRVPWAPGARLRESREGRSGHAHFPGLVLPEPGCGHTAGAATVLHLGWSGGCRMVAEQLPDGRRLVQLGPMPGPAGETLAPGATLETPVLWAAVTTTGLNGAMAALHGAVRRLARLPDPARPRPAHFNSWEAVYFRHDPAELAELATRAAALGAERFVLDDGWFPGRDHDRAGLGDWRVDPAKHPAGLGPLIAHVEALGMRFGLWVEPEMANPDSDLLRARPDWALGGADQPTGRGQRVLDLSREDVRAHLFAALDALLRAERIDYLKWDHNRALPGPDPAQTRGFYALLDRLRAAHPQVEIESCASGGGRIDYGVLARARRVWLSDSNDALERLRIQHAAALFLPPEIAGAHVGPRLCHTSGRTLPMQFRAWVAAQRAMGIEMDPRELTDAEADTLRDAIAWWKANRAWLHAGRLHRLDAPDPAVLAEMTVAADGSRFVVFAGQAALSAGAAQPLPLAGLEPAARYAVSLREPAAPPRALNRAGHALERPVTLSGAALMGGALRPPALFPETMLVLEGLRL